jgi:hypothetical protein
MALYNLVPKTLVFGVLLAVPMLLWCDHRGFYTDDYCFLLNSRGRSAFEFVSTWVTQATGINRPMSIIVHGISFHQLGDNALAFAIALICGHILNTWLLMRTLLKFRCHPAVSLIGAAFFAWMPWHGQVIYWPTCLSIICSTMLLLGSLVTYLEWLRNGRTGLRRVSWCLYALSLLGYDHGLAWFWVWPVVAWMVDETVPLWRSIRHGAGHMAIALACAAFSIAMVDADRAQNHPSLQNLTGIGSLLWRMLQQIHDSVLGIRGFHARLLEVWWNQAPGRLFLLALAVISITCILAARTSEVAGNGSGRLFRRRLMGALLMIVCPVALMTLQTTHAFPNRSMYLTSIGLAWFAGILLEAVCRLSRGVWLSRAVQVTASIAVALCGVATATRSTHWSDSWNIQQDLAAQLRQLCPDLAPRTVLVIDGLPLNLGPHRAPVFEGAAWSLTSRVRLDYDQNDLEARLELRCDATGTVAGIPERNAVMIADRPLCVLHWDSEKSQLSRSSVSEYFQNHPEHKTVSHEVSQ